MKIFDAYLDKALRSHFKEYIEARGLSVLKRDKIHYRFSVYITRIKSVNFHLLLLESSGEADFRDKLNMIFFDKWANHLGYPEIPEYFFIYLDYLKYQSALQPSLNIDGLDPDLSIYLPGNGELCEAEKPFVTTEGKLRLLSNPALITRLREQHLWTSPLSQRAIEACNEFYAGTSVNMLPQEWNALAKKAVGKKTTRAKSKFAFIEIIHPDGSKQVMSILDAFLLVIEMIGLKRVADCALRNHGNPIVVRTASLRNTGNYKPIDDTYSLNCHGHSADRFKTLRALVSVFHLNLTLNLVSQKPEKSPAKTANLASKPATPAIDNTTDKEEENPPLINSTKPKEISGQQLRPQDSNFRYGKDGTLNLFDDL